MSDSTAKKPCQLGCRAAKCRAIMDAENTVLYELCQDDDGAWYRTSFRGTSGRFMRSQNAAYRSLLQAMCEPANHADMVAFVDRLN